MAEKGSPTSPGSKGSKGERRRSADRRAVAEDRRAFWRPTPDRRREHTELGRRREDRPAKSKP